MLEEYCVKLGYQKIFLFASPDLAPMYLRFGYRFTELRYTMIGPMVRMVRYNTSELVKRIVNDVQSGVKKYRVLKIEPGNRQAREATGPILF